MTIKWSHFLSLYYYQVASIRALYSVLLTGEVNTGQFRYSDWLLSGQYNTVKTAS